MTAGILLLAAGRSLRFGSDKRFAILPDGRSVLQASVDNALASGLPLRVCVREGDLQAQPALAGLGVDLLVCTSADGGMGNTLAEAVRQSPFEDGVLIALADMPRIEPATYRSVAAALAPDRICVPTYEGRRGHPVGFGRDLLQALRRLSGGEGARALLVHNPDAVHSIAVDDPGILVDIDTPADLGAVQRRSC